MASTTKKNARKVGKKFAGGDSPICVGGGGSALVDFSEAIYVPNANANPAYYENAAKEITRILFIDRKGVVYKNVSCAGICTIDIDVKDPGDVAKPIVIESRVGGPLRITFAYPDYPRDASVGNRHFHRQRKILSVTITCNGVPDTTYVDEKGSIVVLDA